MQRMSFHDNHYEVNQQPPNLAGFLSWGGRAKFLTVLKLHPPTIRSKNLRFVENLRNAKATFQDCKADAFGGALHGRDMKLLGDAFFRTFDRIGIAFMTDNNSQVEYKFFPI